MLFQVFLLVNLSICFGCIFDDDDDDNGSTMDNNETVNVIERVSFAFDGNETDGDSWVCSISSDGRFVAFRSDATNIVSGDTNEVEDIFIFDRETGTNQRVSIASDGSQANDEPFTCKLSSNGRFVAFGSYATNLVPNDTNDAVDVFVHDREKGITERVSVASDGTQANGDSYQVAVDFDGHLVAFKSEATNLVTSDTNKSSDIFVHDRELRITRRISVAFDGAEADGESMRVRLSSNGRYAAFLSFASNLVPNDPNGTIGDYFVHDQQSHVTELIVESDEQEIWGAPGGSISVFIPPSISPDGLFVGFSSSSDNLVPGDTNMTRDGFLFDRETGIIERYSVSSDGSEADYGSTLPEISADNCFVVFSSAATNLVPDDLNENSDVFIKDRETGQTERVNIAFDGSEGDSYSLTSYISEDGKYIAYESLAENMVENDRNGFMDVFIARNPISRCVSRKLTTCDNRILTTPEKM
jgi:dipeptidyl aminopeptidase/acylaminoacyl peptidase